MSADILDGYLDILRTLAVRRQAEVDGPTFAVYAEDLARESVDLADLALACYRIGRQPSAKYEKAWPPIGDILAACRNARREREDRKLAELAATAPKQLAGPPLSKADAALWLERIKRAAHGQPVDD